MTTFIDKNGRSLELSMTTLNSGEDFENDVFDIGGLKQDEQGRYIVEDVDYLVDTAVDIFICKGDYADNGGKPGNFNLFACVQDMNNNGETVRLIAYHEKMK